MMIGYARVSKTEQDTQLQLDALRRADVRKVFSESGSAVKRRPQLQAMLESLRPGDTVVVYKLDRLARSIRDLLNLVDKIERGGAAFRSLTESFDTTTSAGKMVFQMLGVVAEFERAIITERSAAGVAVARARGVRMGRLPALDDRQSAALVKLWKTEQYSKTELAKMHNVSVSTVKRTLWRLGHDSISDAHANGMLPPRPPAPAARKKARTKRARK